MWEYYHIVIPISLKAVLRSQYRTPIALHALGIFTRLLQEGSEVSYVTNVNPLAAAVATR